MFFFYRQSFCTSLKPLSITRRRRAGLCRDGLVEREQRQREAGAALAALDPLLVVEQRVRVEVDQARHERARDHVGRDVLARALLARLAARLAVVDHARAEGGDFAGPLQILLVRGQVGPGRLRSGRSRGSPGPAAALGALVRGENVDPRAAGRFLAPGVTPSKAPWSLRNEAIGEEVADAVHTSLTHPRARPAMWASRRTRRSAPLLHSPTTSYDW